MFSNYFGSPVADEAQMFNSDAFGLSSPSARADLSGFVDLFEEDDETHDSDVFGDTTAHHPHDACLSQMSRQVTGGKRQAPHHHQQRQRSTSQVQQQQQRAVTSPSVAPSSSSNEGATSNVKQFRERKRMRERERRVALNTGFDELSTFLCVKNKSDKPNILREALASLKRMAAENARLHATVAGTGLAFVPSGVAPPTTMPSHQLYGARPTKRRQIAPATSTAATTTPNQQVQAAAPPTLANMQMGGMPNFGMFMPCLIPFNMPPYPASADATSLEANKDSSPPSTLPSAPPACIPANMPQGFAGLVQFAAATQAAASRGGGSSGVAGGDVASSVTGQVPEASAARTDGGVAGPRGDDNGEGTAVNNVAQRPVMISRCA
jgi:hypothetical protein